MVSPELALLLSRASAAISWRAWEFSASLVLFDIAPTSLSLVAAFGLADTLVQAVSGPALGNYVDRTNRSRSAITMYVVQHVLIVVSCLAAAGAFLFDPGSAGRIGFAAFVIVAGVLAGAGATGSTLSVEQVWVVAICGTDNVALTNLNSKMRAVDLCALLLAPLGAAALLQYAGTWIFVLSFAAYSAVSFFPEVMLLRVASAALAKRQAAAVLAESPQRESPAPTSSPNESARLVEKAADNVTTESALPVAPSSWQSFLSSIRRFCDTLTLYARQPSAPLMIALALLYFTVLSFHGVMTAYLQSEGSSDLVISLFRGVGAIFGLLSTLIFPFITRCISLPVISACSILFQLVFITLGAVPLALDLFRSRDTLLYTFQGGVAVSRLGLWLADLAIMQFIQETTPTEQLGAVQGTQRSVCAIFELLSYVAALVFAQPSQFPVLMLGSLAAVALAAAICTYFAFWRWGKDAAGIRRDEDAGESTPLLRSPAKASVPLAGVLEVDSEALLK